MRQERKKEKRQVAEFCRVEGTRALESDPPEFKSWLCHFVVVFSYLCRCWLSHLHVRVNSPLSQRNVNVKWETDCRTAGIWLVFT